MGYKMEAMEKKITDLVGWVIKSENCPGVEESLNNIRKCGEAICKIIILDYFGRDASKIISGKLKSDKTPISKPTPLNFNNLINLICNSSNRDFHVIKDKFERQKILAYLETIRINSNPASHDTSIGTLTNEDLVHTKNALRYIIVWLFKKQISYNLPIEISNLLKIKIDESIFTYENMRGKDIISLIYPKHENIVAEVHSDTVQKINYEYISIEVIDNVNVGYLFLNKNIAIEKTLISFFKKLPIRLHSLNILTPRIYSDHNEVDRVSSIIKIINNSEELVSIRNKAEVYTVDNFVWEKCLSSDMKDNRANIEVDKYFVDQKIYIRADDNDYKSLGFSINYINDLVLSKKTKNPIHIISGSGGVGKTSFCESLLKKINLNKKKFSLLISSTDMKSINVDYQINTISDLYRLYSMEVNEDQSKVLEENNLEINLSCGNIILIIDGLDEIESTLKEHFNLDKFLMSVIKLNSLYSNCRIIITTRDYNIEKFYQYEELSIYKLKGFDDDIAHKYFNKRFGDQSDVNKAIKYLDGHGITKHSHYIPLYLSLICDSIEREKYSFESSHSSISDSSFFCEHILIDRLIFDVLQREIFKQSLNITCDEYFYIFSEIVLTHNGRIPIVKLNEDIEILHPSIKTTSSSNELSKYNQFYVCPLLQKNTDDNSLSLSYDFLEIWVKSRYLYNTIVTETINSNVYKLFSEIYNGKSQILKELLDLQKYKNSILNKYGQIFISKNKNKINNIDIGKKYLKMHKHAISGFLYYVICSQDNINREKVTETITHLFGGQVIYGLYIYGDFFPINFTNLTIYESLFDGFTNMQKCLFPDHKTVFHYTTLVNIDVDIKQTFNKELFDSNSCNMDEEFIRRFNGAIRSSNKIQELCINDLKKILKVGFSGGAFFWKSELIYRNVRFSNNISLHSYLDFLCEKEVFKKEKSKSGNLSGYVVSKLYRNSAKYLITNNKLKPELECIIVSMLEKYNNLTKNLETV